MKHEGSKIEDMKKLFDDVDEENKANIVLAVLLAYNTRIWGNLQSKKALEGFSKEDWEDANSPECNQARLEYEVELAKTGNETNLKLNQHWQGLQEVLKTASGLRPGSSIVKESVGFKERLTTGQLYQRTRESLKDRVGNFMSRSSIETAEDLVRPVPFANRFEVAYKLRREGRQEKDVVAYLD
jgi:hypothetical protein